MRILTKIWFIACSEMVYVREMLPSVYSVCKYAHIQPCYDLVVSESNLKDACQHLELFLESHWTSTRSVLLSSSAHSQTVLIMRCWLNFITPQTFPFY